MSTPSNLYADKLLSEHPLALWSLDTEAEYVSLISGTNRDLSTWTATNATVASTSDSTAPFSSSYVTQITGTATPSYGSNAQLYLVSPFTFSSTSAGFTVSFYLKTSNRAFLDIGYGSGKIATISTITWNASYLEYTCTGNHNLVAGEYVTVSGTVASGESAYDKSGTVSATGLTSTKFRIYVSVTDYLSGSGGTVIAAKFVSGTIDINPINYSFNSWFPISCTSEDSASGAKLVFRIDYLDTSPIYYINGLTLGQDSEKFNGESFGQSLFSLPATISTSVAKGIETKSYGDEAYSAYYIGNGVTINTQTPTYSAPNITLSTSTPHGFSVGQTVTISDVTPSGYNGTWTTQAGTTGSTLVVNIGSNPGAITVGGNVSRNDELYAKNTSIPMSYGSLNIMSIYPNAAANQPSFIFPGFGFLNEIGRYKELTVEFLARVNVNSSTPKRIFGPLASTDGLYITNEYITLKVGDYIESYYASELFKPTLYQIQIGNGFANLCLDGDTVISMSIDNASLSLPAKLDGSSKSQDWLGFYAYATSVPSVDIDSVAIYPYKVSETLQKRRFVYAQGVKIPEEYASTTNGQTVLIDYPFSNYANNYNYPRTDAKWEQASSIDNFSVLAKETLSPTTYNEPIVQNSLYSNVLWLADLYETNVASGESSSFMNLKPSSVVSGSGRSWTTNTGYIVLDNYDPTKNLTSCLYGVFKAIENSASEQILIKIENNINGDYLKISLTGTTVSYLFKYQNLSEELLVSPAQTITTNTTFAVGIDVAKLISKNGNLATFLKNKSNLDIYIGGDRSLSETFSGNIYKVGLCSTRNAADITSLFDANGYLSNLSTSVASLLPRTATYTLISNNLFSKIIPDIAVNSYWENYVPLSKLAKTVSDASGNDVYALDLIQFNFDYPEPKVYSGSNYDTSASLVKTYVSFQTIISGANAAASTFTTTVSPNSNNVVNATTFSATTKYEVVNNMIIYPPTDMDLTTLAMVIHVESNIPGINTKPTNFRYLQLAAQSFNANAANALGTKHSVNIYPYTQSGTTFNYKSQNPYLIFKESMPYLYLTKYSGIKIAGTYSSGTDRGIYVNTNESLDSDAKIASLQFAALADFKEFPTSSMQILKLEGNGGSISFSIIASNTAKTKGRISTSSEIKPVYYINGKKVANPVISLNEWNMIGIVFKEPISVSGMSGVLKLTSNLLINNLSYYKASSIELQQKATQLLWSEIGGNNWAIPIPTQTPTISVKEITLTTTNSHRLFLSEKVAVRNLVPTEYNTTTDSYVTAIPSTTSFKYLATSVTAPSGAITTAGIALGTWEYSSIPNYFEIYSNNIKDIYKTLTGTNKSIVDSNYEYQGLRLGGYEYLGYLNVEFSEITLDVL